MYLIGFPLLVIPFAIYNMIAFLTPGVGWTDAITAVNLTSGATWSVTAEDMLLGLAIILLPLEILKATRIGVRSVVDHILSMVLFVIMLIEFLLVRQAGTSTFFLLMMVSVVDVLGGFIVTLRTAQRDLTVERVESASPDVTSSAHLMARDFHLPGRSQVIACEGMAATSHPLATLAAIDVLRAGGNAADAAVTAVAVLCVVEPHMTGIGGDCFCLIARSGQAGVGLQRLRPRRRRGCRPKRCWRRASAQIGMTSPHAVTVPGSIEAWDAILKAHGTLRAGARAGAGDPLRRRRLSGCAARRVRLGRRGRQARRRSRRGAALSVQRPRAGRRRRDQVSGAGRDAEGDRQGRPARVL